MPEIRDQEKFGDFAFLNSMALHDKLPPADPWMSGYNINYYYFSHFMIALLTKMSGIAPSISFNLSTPIVMALLASGAFGLVYNLVAIIRNKGGFPAVITGLTSSLFLCWLGNLSSIRQLVAPRPGEGERDPNSGSFFFSWWSPSRVIYDYMPTTGGAYEWRQTINEFPMFSFLLADMHPHVMALPFVLLLVASALNLLLSPADGGALTLRKPEGILNFLLLSISCGALYFINTWDFPTFTLLVVGVALLREIWQGAEEIEAQGRGGLMSTALLGGAIPRNQFRLRGARWLGFSLRLGVVSLLLYTPFHLTFTSLVGEKELPEAVNRIPLVSTIGKLFGAVAWDRTPLWGYILVFGIFIFPLLSFLLVKVYPYLKEPYRYLDENDDNNKMSSKLSSANFVPLLVGAGLFILSELLSITKISLELALAVGLVSAPVLAIGAGNLVKQILVTIRPMRPAFELRIALLVAAVLLVLLGWMVHFELYGPLVMAGSIAGLLLWFEIRKPYARHMSADIFALALILLAVVINWVIEVIYLRDIFESRFNTIFKFYYQTWLLYGLAGAYASWRVIAWLWRLAPFEAAEEESDYAKTVRPEYALAIAGGTSGKFDYSEDELIEVSRLEERKYSVWRWLWVFGLLALVLCGMVYPILGPYEKSGRYADRKGLDGEAWVAQYYGADYAAINWLRQQKASDPNFEGVLLEAEGGDWNNYSRIATFSGYSTVLGWLSHEAQWRGGNAATMAEVNQRFKNIKTIYDTGDIALAKQLLAKYNVKYVYVGLIETGAASASLYSSVYNEYSPEGLAKFRQFMNPIYDKNGVTIYAFK
jgi:YYY domain-containing protein